MSCDHVRAVLSGEAPPVAVDDHLADCAACRAFADSLDGIDALARALPALEPPEWLVESTLAAMDDLVQSSRMSSNPAASPAAPRAAWRWWGGGIAALAAAALALVALVPERPPADPARLVERGVGDRLPDVALKVAVDRQGTEARLSREQRYRAGDTLYFRAEVDQAATLALVRVDAAGASVVHTQVAGPGEADLAIEGGPLAWRIDVGESDAVFAILAATGPFERTTVEAALASTYDPDDPDRACRAAQALGARCAAAAVKVTP